MTTNTTSNAPGTTLVPAATRAVESLVDLGKLWTTQGLEMGRAVLATSAESLRVLSEGLAEVKAQVQGKQAE